MYPFGGVIIDRMLNDRKGVVTSSNPNFEHALTRRPLNVGFPSHAHERVHTTGRWIAATVTTFVLHEGVPIDALSSATVLKLDGSKTRSIQ